MASPAAISCPHDDHVRRLAVNNTSSPADVCEITPTAGVRFPTKCSGVNHGLGARSREVRSCRGDIQPQEVAVTDMRHDMGKGPPKVSTWREQSGTIGRTGVGPATHASALQPTLHGPVARLCHPAVGSACLALLRCAPPCHPRRTIPSLQRLCHSVRP